MGLFRHNQSKVGKLIGIGHLDEADQLSIVISADELALLQKRGVFTTKRLQVLAIMPKQLALPDWRLVVDFMNATN